MHNAPLAATMVPIAAVDVRNTLALDDRSTQHNIATFTVDWLLEQLGSNRLRVGITSIILAPSPFVAEACSRAINLAADPSIYLLDTFFSVWLDRVALLRNLIKTIDFL